MAKSKATTEHMRLKTAVQKNAESHEMRFGQACKMADGGAVRKGLADMDKQIENAVKAPPAAAPKAAAPAPTDEEKDAAVGIHIPKPAAAAAPVKKGLFGLGILGLADGGMALTPGGYTPLGNQDPTEAVRRYRAGLDAGIAAKVAPAPAAPMPPVAAAPAAPDPAAPAPAPVAAAPAFGTAAAPRQHETGWTYSGGHIAMAAGGPVRGPGGPVDDKVPAMLSAGEYVLPADTVKAVGVKKLDALKAHTHTPAEVQRFGTPDSTDSEIAFAADGGLIDEVTKRAKAVRDAALGGTQVPPTPNAPAPYEPVSGQRFTPGADAPGAAPASPAAAPESIPRAADGTAHPYQASQAARAEAAANGAAPPRASAAFGGQPPSAAVPAAEAAAKPGLFGRAVSAAKSATGGLIGGLVRTGAPVAGIVGAGDKLIDDQANPAARAAFQQRMGVTTPTGSALADTADVLGRVGDAATFGYASKLGRGIANKIGGGSFTDGFNSEPAVPSTQNPVPSAGPASAAAPTGTDPHVDAANAATAADAARSQALLQAGVPMESQNRSPVDPTQRGAFVRGEVGNTLDRSQYQNLGDYGQNGAAIFGRATGGSTKLNDFVGRGGGSNVATGYAPKGVDFGITDEARAKYRQDREMEKLQGTAPVYRDPGTSKDYTAAQQSVADASRAVRMATSRPERNQALAQLQAAQATADTFGKQHALDVTQAQARFNGEQNAYNQRLGLASTMATNQANAYNTAAQREFDWQKFALERKDKAQEHADTQGQRTFERGEAASASLDKTADDAAGGVPGLDDVTRKQIGSQLKTYLRTATKGNLRFQDMNQQGQRLMMGEALANAIITKHLGDAGALQKTPNARFGTPYDAQPQGHGPQLQSLAFQKNFGPIDALRDGVQVGGVSIPYSRFPAEAVEYLKAQKGQR
jgi:hypothetical protein